MVAYNGRKMVVTISIIHIQPRMEDPPPDGIPGPSPEVFNDYPCDFSESELYTSYQ